MGKWKPRGSEIDTVRPALLLALAVVLVLSTSSLAATALDRGAGGPASSPAGPPPVVPAASPVGTDPTPDLEVANFSVGQSPSPAVYDPANGYLYVANSGSGSVSVIDAATHAVETTVPVGTDPETPVVATYDGMDQVFVPNFVDQNVTVISGVTNTVVANVTVGTNPIPGVYDSDNGEVYIPNEAEGSANVTVISSLDDEAVASIVAGGYAVGGVPATPGFDSQNDTIWVPVHNSSGYLEVISGVTNTVVETLQLPYPGDGAAGSPLQNAATPVFDPANGNLYVARGVLSTGSPVTVINGTTYGVVATAYVAGYPYAPAYDPVNGNVYVSNYPSDDVIVLSGTSNTAVATVPVGVYPTTAAVDTSNGNIYVPNLGSDNVTVISGATNAVVANLSLTAEGVGPIEPQTPTYDPATAEFYVASLAGRSVAVLGYVPPTTTIAVPDAFPDGVAVDPATDTVYTTDGSNDVSVISGSTDLVTDTIPVGDDPQGIAVDPATDTIYAVNYGSSNVSVINGTTDQVTASIPIGEGASGPEGIAVDPVTDTVYVGVVNGALGGNVVVIDGSTNTVVDTVPTPGFGFGLAAVSLAVDPDTDTVYVQDAGIDEDLCVAPISSCSPLYVISGATDSVTASISLEPSGTGNYPFKAAVDPVTNTVYVADPATGATYVVNGTTNNVTATIPDGTVVVGVAVDPTTDAVYVTDLDDNSVDMISGASDALTAIIPVGHGPAGIAVDPVTDCVYVANIEDSTISELAPFGTLASCSATTYAATFAQSGIPSSGVTWGVTVASSDYTGTGPTLSVPGLDGTVDYVYNSPVPGAGGTTYVCSSGCSGIVTGPIQVSADYKAVAPPPPTNTSVDVACSPDSVVLGAETVCRATVESSVGGIVGESILFSTSGFGTFGPPDGACTIGTGNGSTPTSCSVTYTPESTNGQTQIEAQYLGDANNSASYGTTILFVTLPAPATTSVAVACAPNPVVLGSGTECRASVASSVGGIAGESILFTASGYVYGTFGPTDGACTIGTGNGSTPTSCSVTYTPESVSEQAEETIHAEYVGDANNSGSNGSTLLFVTVPPPPANTSVDVACAPNPVALDAGSVCRATVESSVGEISGNLILFSASGYVYGAFTPSDGACTIGVGNGSTPTSCSVTYTPESVSEQAEETIHAEYVGDANNSGSNGSTLLFVTVPPPPANTSVDVACSPDSVVLGAETVCRATVESSVGGIVGESILFSTSGFGTFGPPDGACAIGTGNGSTPTSCSVTYTPESTNGQTQIEAQYLGDANNSASYGTTILFVTVPTYGVTFIERGLPSGTAWWVNVTGAPSASSTGTALPLDLPNGSYRYAVGISMAGKTAYSAPAGAFTIRGGSLSVEVAFGVVHPVTFTETGLPDGQTWWVNVTGGSNASAAAGSPARVWEPAGRYSYSVGTADTEYAAKAGTFTVRAAALTVHAKFDLVTYSVTFAESGLPTGARWCVAVSGGTTHCTTRASASFDEPNGSYGYTLSTARRGYSATGGTFVVSGAPVTQRVSFVGGGGEAPRLLVALAALVRALPILSDLGIGNLRRG